MALKETYTSLDFIPIYNYVRCQGGDSWFMIVGEQNGIKKPEVAAISREEDDTEESFAERMRAYEEAKKQAEDDITAYNGLFNDILASYEGKRADKVVAVHKKWHLVKRMQAAQEYVKECALGMMDEENTREVKKMAKNAALTMNIKANNRRIQRKIDEVEALQNQESNKMSVNSLNRSVSALSKILGFTIDIMRCSASQYFAFQEQATESIRESINNQAKGR